jgi:predicted RNA-binding protein (virulence factor B family)
MELGKSNKLVAKRYTPQGMYLEDEKGNEVLLPNNRLPENHREDLELEVFVYRDSEERIIASLQMPYAQVGDFAVLEAKQNTSFGTFMDWGLDKQILVPYKEQHDPMTEGSFYGVYIYLDAISERLVASACLERFVEKEPTELEIAAELELLLIEKTELGFLAIADNKYRGQIYHNEIFQPLKVGDKVNAHIRKVREDGKIDFLVQAMGLQNIEVNAQRVLTRLEKDGGFLALTDKSSPEEIKDRLSMSKKTFKKAIGTLYKQRLIKIEDKGLSLNK